MKQRFKENHPAHHDQQVALARDLIPKANAWILLVNTQEGDNVNRMQGMISLTPGTDLEGFMEAAVTTLHSMVVDLFKEVTDDDFDEVGEET